MSDKRREKFQGLLAYFEKFTQEPLFRDSAKSATPLKKSKPKTPKSKSSKSTPIKDHDKEDTLQTNSSEQPAHTELIKNTTLSYDSDTSHNAVHKRKRRQSFGSVRTPKKQPRRKTLAACDISPILMVCISHSHHFTPLILFVLHFTFSRPFFSCCPHSLIADQTREHTYKTTVVDTRISYPYSYPDQEIIVCR
jgi:hypothetical protein